MNRKTILSILLVLLLAGGLIGYWMYNKPHRDLAKATADFDLPAAELFSDYEADEAGADTKYLDKVIRISGTVMEVNTDETGQTSLTLDAGGLLGGVICQLDPAITSTFSVGQEVSLNGLCTGMLMDVILVRCTPV